MQARRIAALTGAVAATVAVAAVRNDTDRAARLAGAAAAHRCCAPQDEVDARLDATFIQPARRRQGADAWDAAARDGGTLSFEDAITYALQGHAVRAARQETGGAACRPGASLR